MHSGRPRLRHARATPRPRALRDPSLVVALSALAARVQRGRTTDAVLETAGAGVLELGMRLAAFHIVDEDLVLRYVATSPARLTEIERGVGRPIRGLRAPLGDVELARQVVVTRQSVYCEHLTVFDQFIRLATGFDPTPLDAQPATAGITNGVLAPLYVREQPWGFLAVVSRGLTQENAAAVALFAMQVASSLEVAEFIEALERANGDLSAANASVARAQEKLVAQERLAALGQLAATVAHEIRNPLGVLFNSIGSLRRLLKPAPSTRPCDVGMLLSIISEELERMNRIVSELLDFARPHPPALQSGSLLDVIEDAIAAATIAPGASGLDVRIDVPPEMPLIGMDPGLLRQAILNLVLNGLQAMNGSGTLTVRARTEQGNGCPMARVDVIDTGPGIPAEHRSRIYEPFFTTKASGTGLGLAIVKRVLEAHGGDVAVESGSGGATFTVRIPINAMSCAARVADPC